MVMKVRPPSLHLITLLTDFGMREAFVGIMKGVILSIAPEAQLGSTFPMTFHHKTFSPEH